MEAASGNGVAWLAPNAELLDVEFDDVRWESDVQSLVLSNGEVVSIQVRPGKVTVRVKPRGRSRAA